METVARARFDELENQFQEQMAALKQLIQQADTEAEKKQLLVERNPAGEFSKQFLINAKKYPGTDAGRDSALFAVGQLSGQQKTAATKLLVDYYADKIKLSKIVDSLKQEVPSGEIEDLFHSVINKASSDPVKAYSMFGFAKYINQIAFFKKTLEYNPEFAQRLPSEQLEYINRPRSDAEKVALAEMLRTVIDNYGEITYQGRRTFGEVANSELFELENLQVGQVSPEIEGRDLDDIPFRLSDYRGKIVMLDFWGHWCPPCRAMYDHERLVTNKLADKPFVLLGVNSDRELETARAAVREETLSWRHFWNGEQGTLGPIATTWNVEAWPTVYLIDAEGVIRYKSVLGEEIDNGIEALMAEMGYEVDLSEDNEPVGAGN